MTCELHSSPNIGKQSFPEDIKAKSFGMGGQYNQPTQSPTFILSTFFDNEGE
jgi:hypothetical protein